MPSVQEQDARRNNGICRKSRRAGSGNQEHPGIVCPNCDEAYYSIDTQRKIDRIMKAFHEGKLLAKPLAAGEVDLMALETCQSAARAAIEDL